MGVRLKNPNSHFPPGGYTFDDPHTAMHFPGEGVDLHSQALKVIEHRKANPHIYKPEDTLQIDLEEVKRQIVIQVCARQPSYCVDEAHPDRPYPHVDPTPKKEVKTFQGKKCAKCGAGEFEPVYCRSCGGSRVQSWKCANCGFDQG